MLLFPLHVLNGPVPEKHLSADKRFLYYSNIALSIEHCKKKNKTKKN